jgi:hypothetical protein
VSSARVWMPGAKKEAGEKENLEETAAQDRANATIWILIIIFNIIKIICSFLISRVRI